MPQQNASHLIWIDLEMTGLDTLNDEIIEIATIVTDSDLNELATGPSLAIYQPVERLQKMDEWNTRQHGQSGLWQRVLDSATTTREAEQATLAFLQEWVPAGTSPMCGNSICQDRRFMARLMPDLERYFHYRHIDVSTLKELAKRWVPEIEAGFKKASQHLALEDIRDSIQELQHYRQHWLKSIPAE